MACKKAASLDKREVTEAGGRGPLSAYLQNLKK